MDLSAPHFGRAPTIVLIGSLEDLRRFDIKLTVRAERVVRRVWPGKVSVILPCPSKKFAYLHRGSRSIAFRLPRPLWLREFLMRTGPLAAPSANVEGAPPARTIREARGYFGEKAKFYVGVGRLVSAPSTLVAIDARGKARILRQGAAKVAL
jgi:L-threonylcarbamoyladenylate synthase